MVDYILQNEDLDVFGGPSTIDLSLDFGRTGERGGRTWVGSGNPAVVLASQDVKLYDLYVNTSQSDYGWTYQYIPDIGFPQWVKVLRPNPASRISSVVFTSGEGILQIPTSTITSDTTLATNQFTIRYSIEDASGNPIASSFTYSLPTILGVRYIEIVINGAEWNGTSWSSLNSVTPYKVHTSISYLG
jgi:hypothetical protein